MKNPDENNQKLINYNINRYLHNLIVVYKGFSDNKFVNYLNTIDRRDKNGNKILIEKINSTIVEGKIHFVVFFNNDNKEATLYSFESMVVNNWLTGYLENCVNKIEWK